MKKQPLSKRQAQVLHFIEDYIDAYGIPPTIRDIGSHLRIVSNNGISDHLGCLEKKGYITRRPYEVRSIRLTYYRPVRCTKCKNHIGHARGIVSRTLCNQCYANRKKS